MTDGFDEVLRLAADLTDAPEKANRNVKKAVEVTARHIKDDMQQQAERNGLEKYSRSIDYDMRFPGGAIGAGIGPNLGKPQGTFGFVDEGGGDVRSAPQHAARDALKANEDEFERGLQIALLDSLEG